MIKKYKIQGIDCANCALKLERKLNQIDGVNKITIGFLAERLTIDAVDDKFDDIFAEVVRVTKKFEPDCEIK